MRASTKRILSILIAFALAMIAIIGYMNFVKPEYDTTQTLRGELAAKTIIYDEQASAAEQIKNLVTQTKGISKENLNLALPSKEGVADILNQIYTISFVSGINIKSFDLSYLPLKLGKSESDIIKNRGTLRLGIGLTGSYDALKKILASLENNLRVMDVQSLKISPAEKELNVFNYNLVVDTYYQPE